MKDTYFIKWSFDPDTCGRMVGLVVAVIVLLASVLSPAWSKTNLPAVACSESTIFPRGADPRPLPDPTLPVDGEISVNISHFAASKLAYYVYDRGALLAPRGWHCDYVFSGGLGYIVQIHPTSGNYGITQEFWMTDGYITSSEVVAEWANTYFLGTVKKIAPHTVITLDNGHNWTPDGAYAYPKYRTDRLTYLSAFAMVFVTPAHKLGVGSQFFRSQPVNSPKPTAQNFPIEGFINLSDYLSDSRSRLCHLVIYAAGLPLGLRKLETIILKNAEQQPTAEPSHVGSDC